MKIDDVMKLVNAGFSKDEIIKYFGDDSSPEATPEPEPEATPEPAPAPKATPEPAPAPDAMKEVLDSFLDSFKTVIKDINAANIAGSSMPDHHHESAEEVLASIIAPPAKMK